MSQDWTARGGWEAACKKAVPIIMYCGAISTFCTVVSITFPFFSIILAPIGILATFCVPIVHAWYANKFLLTPSYRRLSPSRRIFLRWGSRIVFLQLILYVYTPSILVVAIITCPLGFWCFTRVQLFCIEWQLKKESNGEPLTKIEKLALFLLFGISGIVFLILVAIAFLFGLAIQEAIPFIQDFIQQLSNIPEKMGL